MKRLLKRLREIRNNTRRMLTMNQRNLHYIYPYNHRRYFPIADNKLLTKEVLQDAAVAVPDTLLTYDAFYALRTLEEELCAYSDFVIKPARGSGGGGIVVITRKTGDTWYSAGGTAYNVDKIKRHITDIIFGVYSFGLSDVAIIEQRIDQHPFMCELSPLGLADVRLIVHKHEPVLCMCRIPTQASDGKANLHQGALGIGIDIDSGLTSHAILKDKQVTHHPDTGIELIGNTIPYWDQVIAMSRAAAEHVPLKYLGIDIAIGTETPLLLEINVRPGLQIQNANQMGMRPGLEALRYQTGQTNSQANSWKPDHEA